MTNRPLQAQPISIEDLDHMARSIAKRADVLREEGEMLADRLESLDRRSEQAIREARDLNGSFRKGNVSHQTDEKSP